MSDTGDRRKKNFGRPAGRPGQARPQADRRGPYGRPAPAPKGEQPSQPRSGPYGRLAPKAEGGQAGPKRMGRRPLSKPGFGRQPPPAKAPAARPGMGQPGRQQPSLSSDARRAALDVLNRVLLEGGYASLSLDEAFQQLRLSFRDRRLCTQMVYLTLENLNRLDFALDRLMEAPERLDKRVRNLLRLSAAQILLLDRVPDSAAVNEAVNIVRDMGLEELTGLVNGILRNLIRQMDSIPWPKPEEGFTYYQVMYSQPQWLSQRIIEQYGEEEADAILRYKPKEHALTIRRNTSRITQQAFEEMLSRKRWTVSPGQLPEARHIMGVYDLGRDEDYLEGYFTVQGEGSMVAAMALQPRLGSQVLDCCAAPGGKTALISEHMQGTGRIHAWDLHAHRVDLLSAMAQRMRLYNIRPAVRDALVFREQMVGTMDAIIIDAPCTGSGVMHEKPDIRLRLSEEGLAALVATQASMLDTVSQYLKPGGILVYATCSILAEENEQQVERFLRDHPAFAMAALPESIPHSLRGHEGPFGLQLLPHRHHTEGFFIARMQLK